MFAPVFLEDQLHHVILEVVGKIYVNVRQFVQRHALLVQESAEIQVEADGAYSADFKTVTDEAVRRAASRNPFDAAPPTLLKEVPGDEEIFLVTNLVDDAKFLRHLWVKLFGPWSVAVAQTLDYEPPQKLARRRTVGWHERGELGFAERKIEIASLRDFECGLQPVGMTLGRERHFVGRAKVKTTAAPLFWMFLPQKRQRANALHDVKLLAVIRRRVTNRGASRRWKVGRHLSCADDAIEATGEHFRHTHVIADGDQPLRQSVELFTAEWAALLGGDRTLVVIRGGAFGVTRQQTTKVVIPVRGLDVEQNGFVSNTDLRANNGLHTGILCRLDEFDDPVQVARIGQRDCLEFVPFRQLYNRSRRKRGVKKRVMAVDAQWHIGTDFALDG